MQVNKTQSIEVYIRIKDKNLKEGMYMEAQIKAMNLIMFLHWTEVL